MSQQHTAAELSEFLRRGGQLNVGTTYAPTLVQTYSTADQTLATPGAAALILTATNIAAKTPSATLTDANNASAATVATSLDQAQKDLGTMINSLRTDLVDLAQFVNSVVDALQAQGLLH